METKNQFKTFWSKYKLSMILAFISNIDSILNLTDRVNQTNMILPSTEFNFQFDWFDFVIKTAMAIALGIVFTKMKKIQDDLLNYKTISTYVNEFRTQILYTGEGLTAKYIDKDFQKKVYDQKFWDEYNFVYDHLLENHPDSSPNEIKKALKEYYNLEIQTNEPNPNQQQVSG